MPTDNPDIDAVFERFMGQHPFIHYDMLKYDLPHVLRIAYLAGLSDGVDKAAAVYRGINADLSLEGLSERIRLSNVAERIAADLNRLDVTG